MVGVLQSPCEMDWSRVTEWNYMTNDLKRVTQLVTLVHYISLSWCTVDTPNIC